MASTRWRRATEITWPQLSIEALQHMIQNLVTHNQQINVLTIPPPILSRAAWQHLHELLVSRVSAFMTFKHESLAYVQVVQP